MSNAPRARAAFTIRLDKKQVDALRLLDSEGWKQTTLDSLSKFVVAAVDGDAIVYIPASQLTVTEKAELRHDTHEFGLQRRAQLIRRRQINDLRDLDPELLREALSEVQPEPASRRDADPKAGFGEIIAAGTKKGKKQ